MCGDAEEPGGGGSNDIKGCHYQLNLIWNQIKNEFFNRQRYNPISPFSKALLIIMLVRGLVLDT